VGDTYLEPPEVARAEAQHTAKHPRLHNYAPVQGEPVLLDAIMRKIERRTGERLAREHLQVMSGATSGLGVVCTALLEPGDEVLLPAPFWPLIRGIIRFSGGVPVEVPLHTRLDAPDPVAALERAITPRTTAIYLNSPHNPTGTVLGGVTVDAIVELALRHDLWVLTDEVYEDVWFGDAPPEPLWLHPKLRDRVIVTHSLSKSYGLAGARVGYTHGPPEAMEVIRGVQTFYTYCAPRPMQFAAARVLDEGDGWLDDMRVRYRAAARAAADALELPMPAGGTFLFFDAAPYMRDEEDIAGLLTRCMEAGVMLTPGTAAGKDFPTWVRLCFTAVPPDELDAALKVLRGELGLR
jgi:N-succinyldiaminopimelate aminotransferase